MVMPKVFIGSSTESIEIANAIQENLIHDFNPIIWNRGFNPGDITLEKLESYLNLVDYAIFVFGPDDRTTIRAKEWFITRDNVIFELGLFAGHLSHKKCFVVCPKDVADLRILTDFAGVTVATYRQPESTSEVANALSPACNQIRRTIQELRSEDINIGPTLLTDVTDTSRGYYDLATKMLTQECSAICLIQLSSTILLGPESSNPSEALCFDLLRQRIAEGSQFLHLTSIKGIIEQLNNPSRHYPQVKQSLDQLDRSSPIVRIAGKERTWSIHVVDDQEPNLSSAVQLAPAFIVQYRHKKTEGLCIAITGPHRTCFRMAGRQMDDFLRRCADFILNCPLMRWNDIDAVIGRFL